MFGKGDQHGPMLFLSETSSAISKISQTMALLGASDPSSILSSMVAQWSLFLSFWEDHHLLQQEAFLKDAYPFYGNVEKLKHFDEYYKKGSHVWQDLIDWARNHLEVEFEDAGHTPESVNDEINKMAWTGSAKSKKSFIRAMGWRRHYLCHGLKEWQTKLKTLRNGELYLLCLSILRHFCYLQHCIPNLVIVIMKASL